MDKSFTLKQQSFVKHATSRTVCGYLHELWATDNVYMNRKLSQPAMNTKDTFLVSQTTINYV